MPQDGRTKLYDRSPYSAECRVNAKARGSGPVAGNRHDPVGISDPVA